MRALWASPHVGFKGRWHTIEDAGINPRPAARKIPLWYGGHADVTLRRCAKWGDGGMRLAYPPGDEAKAAIATLPHYTEEAGRDPAAIGIDTRVSAGAGAEAGWGGQVRLWEMD